MGRGARHHRRAHTTEQFGITADGATLTGPGGLQRRPVALPGGLERHGGISDTEIKIGWPSPLSGLLADFGGFPKGAKAVLDAYSTAGAFV